MKAFWVSIAKALLLLVVINSLAGAWYRWFDLTEDARYTLSEPAINAAKKFNSPVIIDVLLDGEIPAEFSRLKIETIQLLEVFASKNQNIKYNLVDPLEGATDAQKILADLQSIGLNPAQVTVEENGKVSQELVFPWAIVNYNEKTVKVPLFKNKLGSSQEERINNSVQQLEYAFADAFTKLGIIEKKRVAVLKGNGELEDIYLADYLTSIREYYNIGAITLDSVASNPERVLEQLKSFDLAIIAKPTEPFTDKEKYVLDQFMVNGGRSIWLIDQVQMERDSLFNNTGSAFAVNRDLNLNDLFFSYGVRFNPVLVKDLYFTQIVLATGEDNNSQFNPAPWYYNPMVFSKNNHPVNKNIEALRFQFPGTIDTLTNENRKTILLSSSPLSKSTGTPKLISLAEIGKAPDKDTYRPGNFPLAVLVEGSFNSAYKNRVTPIDMETHLNQGPDNKMIVIADGDVVKNQLRNGRPLELGFDKWTNITYGNKEFLINCINYMLEDTGLINIRNKRVTIPLLDSNKIQNQKTKWQLINIGLPVVLTLLFGWIFNRYRKRKYSR